MIRLLIAAPSPVLRAGLESLVASAADIQLLGAHADMSAAAELRPDVVLAALDADDLSPAAAIVVIGGELSWSAQALRSGVRAILPDNASAREILAAIDAAAAGLAVIDPHELEPLVGGLPRATESAGQALTPRELEVLQLLAEGAANKTIAWKLDVSEHTVKFHVASLMAKLNAGSRTEAVTIGIRQGMVLI